MYFDVQPITVKAYGGRRYTSQRRLILELHQKIRGKFYLFLIDEVNSGRVHWAFLPGKSSMEVSRFMQRVRHWYPDPAVWIGLDQDHAQPDAPCTS